MKLKTYFIYTALVLSAALLFVVSAQSSADNAIQQGPEATTPPGSAKKVNSKPLMLPDFSHLQKKPDEKKGYKGLQMNSSCSVGASTYTPSDAGYANCMATKGSKQGSTIRQPLPGDESSANSTSRGY